MNIKNYSGEVAENSEEMVIKNYTYLKGEEGEKERGRKRGRREEQKVWGQDNRVHGPKCLQFQLTD